MDSEAAVIRSEMSQTRAQLDHKLARLEERARALRPRQYARDHLPEHLVDQVIGGVLTIVGLAMAWAQFRARRSHRARVREALISYGRW
jgi:hypothetical protein